MKTFHLLVLAAFLIFAASSYARLPQPDDTILAPVVFLNQQANLVAIETIDGEIFKVEDILTKDLISAIQNDLAIELSSGIILYSEEIDFLLFENIKKRVEQYKKVARIPHEF